MMLVSPFVSSVYVGYHVLCLQDWLRRANVLFWFCYQPLPHGWRDTETGQYTGAALASALFLLCSCLLLLLIS